MATKNPAYFIEVSNLVYMCQTNGLVAIIDPLETGDLLTMALANGPAKCLAYGQWLGTFFGGFTNIIWMSGNDYDANNVNQVHLMLVSPTSLREFFRQWHSRFTLRDGWK